jgi:uncharacterized damage-inducible protein DinB
MSAAAVRRILQRAFDEYFDGLEKALAGLSAEERRFQIGGDANHIDFIVWHMARNEDGTVSACARVPELWRQAGWYQRFGLPEDADGCGFAVEDVSSFPTLDVEELRQYFSDVRARTLSFLDTLRETDLDLPLSPSAPDVAIAQVLSHLVVEQSQHLGQVALIRGVQRGLEFSTSWNNPDTPTPQ